MDVISTITKGLATVIGILIACAIANANIEATNATDAHALMIWALAAGIVGGSAAIGGAVKESRPFLAAFLFVSLFAGEAANFLATGDRLVTAREEAAAPLKAQAATREEAIDRLASAETSKPSQSERTSLALKAVADAKAEVSRQKETGCKRLCRDAEREQAKVEAELHAALAADQAAHAQALEAARDTVKASPVPASATPLADRLGWAPWVLDLMLAGFYSLGANGLAGGLIAFGTHGLLAVRSEKIEALVDRPVIVAAPIAANDAGLFDKHGQTDYPALSNSSTNVIAALFGNDDGNPPNNSGPKPGRRASPYKAPVCEDIVARFKAGEHFGKQSELQAAVEEKFGIKLKTNTFSDWVCELDAAGLIPTRQSIGRRKACG